MNIKLCMAATVLMLVGSANIFETESSEPVVAASPGPELADLERDYHRGELDEQQYFAKREMLLTAWELTLMDRPH